MRPALLSILAILLMGGCATMPDGSETAREVVLKQVGNGVGTLGPFNRKDKKELASLSPQDRSTAIALLDGGALGFLVFGPDDGKNTGPGTGPLADMVKVERILFVQHGRIVGDFTATK